MDGARPCLLGVRILIDDSESKDHGFPASLAGKGYVYFFFQSCFSPLRALLLYYVEAL